MRSGRVAVCLFFSLSFSTISNVAVATLHPSGNSGSLFYLSCSRGWKQYETGLINGERLDRLVIRRVLNMKEIEARIEKRETPFLLWPHFAVLHSSLCYCPLPVILSYLHHLLFKYSWHLRKNFNQDFWERKVLFISFVLFLLFFKWQNRFEWLSNQLPFYTPCVAGFVWRKRERYL